MMALTRHLKQRCHILILLGVASLLTAPANAQTVKFCKGFTGITNTCKGSGPEDGCLAVTAYNDTDKVNSCFWVSRNYDKGTEQVSYTAKSLLGRDLYQEFPTSTGNCLHEVTAILPEGLSNRVGAIVYFYNPTANDNFYPEDFAARCIILPALFGGPAEGPRNCSTSLNLPPNVAGDMLGNLAVHVTYYTQQSEMINYVQCDREQLPVTSKECDSVNTTKIARPMDVKIVYTATNCLNSPDWTRNSVFNLTYLMGPTPFVSDAYDWFVGYENGGYWDEWTWLAYGFSKLKNVQWKIKFNPVKTDVPSQMVVMLMERQSLLNWMNNDCKVEYCPAPSVVYGLGSGACLSNTYCEGNATKLDPAKRYDLWWGYPNATFQGVNYKQSWVGISQNPRQIAEIRVRGKYDIPTAPALPMTLSIAARSAITGADGEEKTLNIINNFPLTTEIPQRPSDFSTHSNKVGPV